MRKQQKLWTVPPMEVHFRGTAMIPISRMAKKIEKTLTATPKRSRSAPGKAVSFPVFKITGDHILIPKYVYGSGTGLKIGAADKADTIVDTSPNLREQPKFDVFTGSLRDKQKPGVEAAIKVLQKWNGVTIRGKCGSGKTVVGTYLLWRIRSERSAVLVDQTKIAEQWAQTIHRHIPSAHVSFIMPLADQRKICKKIGLKVEGRTKVDTSGDIIIVMAQTAHRNLTVDGPLDVTLLVVDEAHKFSAPTFVDTIFKMSFRYSISLSATDERPDKLSWVFKRCLGPIVVELKGDRMDPVVLTVMAPLARKIDEKEHTLNFCHSMNKHISNFGCELFNCNVVDVCTYKEIGNKTNFSEMWSRLANDTTYNMFLVQLIYAFWKTDRHAIIFSKFKDHLTKLRDMVITGVPEKDTSLFFGGMDKDICLKPRLTFTTYKNSEHALDAPHKDASLLAMPITHAVQSTGRIERFREGKRQPVIIDPLIQSVSTFKYQHESHLKYYREEGYEVIRCSSPDDALRWLHSCGQRNQTRG